MTPKTHHFWAITSTICLFTTIFFESGLNVWHEMFSYYLSVTNGERRKGTSWPFNYMFVSLKLVVNVLFSSQWIVTHSYQQAHHFGMVSFRYNLYQLIHTASLLSAVIMIPWFCESLRDPFLQILFPLLWASQNGYAENNTGIMTIWYNMELYKWIQSYKWWILHNTNCNQCFTQPSFVISHILSPFYWYIMYSYI
jgi:hypothetical protein